jgi:hypothetical protein
MIIPDDVYDVIITLHHRHERALRTIGKSIRENGRMPRSILLGLMESESELGELLIAIQSANQEVPIRAS